MTPPRDHESLRCHCGSLLARLVDAGVELKCRRCKRVFVVPLLPEVRRPIGGSAQS